MLQVVVQPVFSEEFLDTDASNVHHVDTAVFDEATVASSVISA